MGRPWAKWKIHCGVSVFTYLICSDINDCCGSSLPERVTHVNDWIDFCWDCISNLYIATRLGICTNKWSYWKMSSFAFETFWLVSVSSCACIRVFPVDFYCGKEGQTLLSYHWRKTEFELHKGDPNFKTFFCIENRVLKCVRYVALLGKHSHNAEKIFGRLL